MKKLMLLVFTVLMVIFATSVFAAPDGASCTTGDDCDNGLCVVSSGGVKKCDSECSSSFVPGCSDDDMGIGYGDQKSCVINEAGNTVCAAGLYTWSNDDPGTQLDPCGDSRIVTWTVASSCEPDVTCFATFTVTDAPIVTITCPTDLTVTDCQTQAQVDQAFADWIATARELRQACGEFKTDLLLPIFQDWDRERIKNQEKGASHWWVTRPGSLVRVARAKAGELRLGGTKKIKTASEFSEVKL